MIGITNAAQLKNKLLIEIANAAQHWELKLLIGITNVAQLKDHQLAESSINGNSIITKFYWQT